MVKVCKHIFPKGIQGTRSEGYYMDQDLYHNMLASMAAIVDDWDMVNTVDGAEGSGKSVLAQQMAFLNDTTFNLDRIVFRPDEFKQAVLKSKKYQSIVYDEAYGGLASPKAMSDVNKSLVSMLTEIRQKNLFIYVVLPTFFDLQKYVALWRSRSLIHVYTDGFKRGFFRFYNFPRKKDLFVIGKKFYNYKCVRPNFIGCFTKFYTVDKEAYEKKKLESLRVYDELREKEKDPDEAVRESNRKIANQLKLKGMTLPQIGEILGMTSRTISNYLKDYKESETGN